MEKIVRIIPIYVHRHHFQRFSMENSRKVFMLMRHIVQISKKHLLKILKDEVLM